MRKIFFLGNLVLAMAMVACNKSNDAVSPSSNSKVLGLVVQPAAGQNSALILLKDGRAINPLSGFNPSQVSAGNKFVLSFEPVSTVGKIINVNVTSYTSANDSTFVPPSTGSDSVAFKSAMQGDHHCTFTSAVVDYAHPADTTKVTKEFNIIVNGNTFECYATYAPVPGGNGIYYFNEQTHNLNFINYAHFPSNSNIPPGFLLSGQYYHAVFDKYIAIWTYNNTTYSGFLVTR